MPRPPRFCGVILSAGFSTRMGSDKALLPWPPPKPEGAIATPVQTFLSAAIRCLAPYTEMVIVVAGKNEPDLAPVVYSEGASLVRNPEPERGQFSSLQVGLRDVLNRGRDAALITLVDRPPVQATTIATVCDTFAAAPVEIWAVIPEYKGRHGHPFAAARELIEAFLRAPTTATAREVEHQHQPHIRYVDVDDPNLSLNVDTPEDYAALHSKDLSH
jgi:molybdenum cofactor cytidylyltransferase